MDEGDIYTVRCLITRNGDTAHYEADLVFLDEVPHVVIEWQDLPDGQQDPVIRVALNPKYLHRIPWEGVDYLYEMPIEDPRKLD